MTRTIFNKAQIEILDMMSFVNDEEMLNELKQIISDYFAQKAQSEIDKMWETGTLSEDKVEFFKTIHERTPY